MSLAIVEAVLVDSSIDAVNSGIRIVVVVFMGSSSGKGHNRLTGRTVDGSGVSVGQKSGGMVMARCGPAGIGSMVR